MTFDQVWQFFRGMKGQRLATLDQHKTFTLDDVTAGNLTVRVEATGYPRTIPRSQVEEAWNRLSARGKLARTEIARDISRFNPAYVASLLAKVPGVNHTLSPIVLTVSSEVRPAPQPTDQPGAAAGGADESSPGDVDEDDAESIEVEASVADRLTEQGRALGFDVQKEWRTALGNRVDVVWAWSAPPALSSVSPTGLVPVIGFEIESSARSRKHVKGDIFNLIDLSAAIGIIVLCQGPKDSAKEISSLRSTAARYVAGLGLKIQIWLEDDVDKVCGAPSLGRS